MPNAALPLFADPAAPVERVALPKHAWRPDRVLFTPDALAEPFGARMHARLDALGLPIEVLGANRLVGLRGRDARETYRLAKRTLSVVTAPAGQLRLQPIPPSADWQFHLAQGCPAHCQYCYLAGSLSGPPTVRVYANLPTVLGNLPGHVAADGTTSFEASCYTDPLAIEHLTGSLAETVRWFGARDDMARARLRWVSKFTTPALVAPLLDLPHGGRVRARASVNAAPVARAHEPGVPAMRERLAGLGALARAGQPVGLVIAPIMPIDDWAAHYGRLLDDARAALPTDADLTVELITHRFTPGSREVLRAWYPGSALEMDPALRTEKRGKFGAVKHVYPRETMRALRDWFTRAIGEALPQAKVLYWT